MMISRHKRLTLVATLGVGLVVQLLSPPDASAQSFSTLRFRPGASPLNYYYTESGKTLPHLSPSVGLFVHYDHRPLQVINRFTNERIYDEVKYQVGASVMAAFGLLNHIELGVVLPLVIHQTSGNRPDGFPPKPSLTAGIGDLRIIPKLRLVTVGPFTATVAASVDLPTGDHDNYLGDDNVGVEPRAILSLDWKRLSVAINGSVRLRPNRSFMFSESPQRVTVDDELFLSIGARFAIWRTIELIADGHAVITLGDQDPEERSGEVLGGVRFHLPLGFTANVGAGPGIGRGVGTPAVRILFGLHWMYKKKKPKGPGDRDRDGILDPVDQCPDEPEDRDGFEDEDGCPDPDNDEDGIRDNDDECPNTVEDKDGYADDDGCPELDNDHDGLPDTKDRCPKQPEDRDGFDDADGCPDPDNDGDQIADVDDRCPNQPETVNGVDDTDGCPDQGKGPVRIQHGRITVPAVYFATNKDRILRRSFPVLKQVAKLLADNPWVKKVRVEGHTDDRGADDFNLNLSRRRAASVTQFLVNEGINSDRLAPEGFGETQPVASNKSKKGRAKNRRVDFIIVDPPAGPPASR